MQESSNYWRKIKCEKFMTKWSNLNLVLYARRTDLRPGAYDFYDSFKKYFLFRPLFHLLLIHPTWEEQFFHYEFISQRTNNGNLTLYKKKNFLLLFGVLFFAFFFFLFFFSFFCFFSSLVFLFFSFFFFSLLVPKLQSFKDKIFQTDTLMDTSIVNVIQKLLCK